MHRPRPACAQSSRPARFVVYVETGLAGRVDQRDSPVSQHPQVSRGMVNPGAGIGARGSTRNRCRQSWRTDIDRTPGIRPGGRAPSGFRRWPVGVATPDAPDASAAPLGERCPPPTAHPMDAKSGPHFRQIRRQRRISVHHALGVARRREIPASVCEGPDQLAGGMKASRRKPQKRTARATVAARAFTSGNRSYRM